MSDSRRLRLEKRHAERTLLRLMRAAHLSNCRWVWATHRDEEGSDDSARRGGSELEYRLCLYRKPGARPQCHDFDEQLLINAANGDAHAEWLLEDRLRRLVARTREREGD